MKKTMTRTKKLMLGRETVKALETHALEKVDGAGVRTGLEAQRLSSDSDIRCCA